MPLVGPLKSRVEMTLAGRRFVGAMGAAGAVIPIFSSTTQQFGLWNPAGSNRILEVAKLGLGSYVDTTGAAGGYVIAAVKKTSAIPDGTRVTTWTETEPENALTGMAVDHVGKFAQGATLTVIAPAIIRHLNWNQNAFTAAATTGVIMPTKGPVDEFLDRDLWIPPGNLIVLAGNIATLAKFAPCIEWIEHDWQ